MSILLRGLLAAALLSPLALAPAPALAQDADPRGAASHGAETTLGPLVLSGGFSRATRPGAPVAGGFLTVTNTGSEDDTLTAATAGIAGVTQIHEMAMEDGIMKMRELTEGLPIPAGETVVLEPGGYHVMFLDLKAPLVEHETIEATLTFARAGTVTVPIAVLAPDAQGLPAHAGH